MTTHRLNVDNNASETNTDECVSNASFANVEFVTDSGEALCPNALTSHPYNEQHLVNAAPIQHLPIESVSVVNSSDVQFGNRTFYEGPITIKQFLNDTTKNDNNASNSRTLLQAASHYVSYTTVIAAVVSLMLAIATVILIVRFVVPSDPQDTFQPSRYEQIPINSHFLIKRTVWAPEKGPGPIRELKHPVEWVVISHTAGNFCVDLKSCLTQARVALLQMLGNKQLADIGYNFLVGGDGNVFECRGWNVINMHGNNSIGVGLLGEFQVKHELNTNMIESIIRLLEIGVEMGKLRNDYRIVAHNQTAASLSPGVNVYKVIKTWSNFYNGSIRL